MKWIRSLAGALAMAASGPPAAAAAISNCSAPPGAVNVALPSGLPPALRDAMGNIALPGEPFDSTDVYVKGHKYRRYLFVWNAGARWIVTTEQGGIALRSAIYVYTLGKDGKTATLIDQRMGLLNNVCGAATNLTGSSRRSLRRLRGCGRAPASSTCGVRASTSRTPFRNPQARFRRAKPVREISGLQARPHSDPGVSQAGRRAGSGRFLSPLGAVPHPSVRDRFALVVLSSEQDHLATIRIVGHGGIATCSRPGRSALDPVDAVPQPGVVQHIHFGVQAAKQNDLTASDVVSHGVSLARRRAGLRRFLSPGRAVPYPGVIQDAGIGVEPSEQQNLAVSCVVGHGLSLA